MSWLTLKCALLFLSVAFFMCDGETCPQGDVTLTANECTELDELFSSNVSVLPGSNITLTCSVVATSVSWKSSWFAMPVTLDGLEMAAMESNITFQLDTVSTNPLCSNATATITNIQESMDGLDLSCVNPVPMLDFTSTVMFDVIDPPGPVAFEMVEQYGNTITTSWNEPTSKICPVTRYTVSISDVSDEQMSVVNQTSHTYSINENVSSTDNVCGRTLEINVSAINDAGTSDVNTTNITVACTPTNISIVRISDETTVIQWTHTDVLGVTLYEIMSMNGEMPSTPLEVPSTMTSASVRVNDYAESVTFNVTSLTAELQRSFTAYATLQPIIDDFTMEPGFEMGIVNFGFQVTVVDYTLTWSPNNGTCDGNMPPTMKVIITCSGLENREEYTVTVEGSLNAKGQQIPFTFSQLLTPVVSPPSTTSATSASTDPPTESSGLGQGVITTIVVIALAVVALLIFVLCLMGVIKYLKSRTRKARLGCKEEADGDDPVALVEKKAKDPKTGEVGICEAALDGQEKQVPHQEAPTGDEYAVVDKPATRRAAPSTPQFEAMTYQDPNTIQRHEAPTGDLYALPQSKGKETKESMPVYSEVNKQPDRVYADLALPKGGDSGVNRQPPTQEGFVMYSEILPAAGPPARPPKPQESIPEKSLYSEIQQPPPPPSPLAEHDSMIAVPEEESLYEKYQSN